MILGLQQHVPAQCFIEINNAVKSILGNDHRVVFNAHCFAAPENTIVYNLENLVTNPDRIAWAASREVWDFNKQNIPCYPAEAKVFYVPIGYHPSMERFGRSEILDIDLVFCGTINPRRAKILGQIADKGYKVNIINNCVFGKERDGILARSRLALNIHHYVNPDMFESVRVSHLIANQVPVLTEESTHRDEQLWGLNGIPYEKLVDAVVDYLERPQLHLETMSNQLLDTFKKNPFRLPIS